MFKLNPIFFKLWTILIFYTIGMTQLFYASKTREEIVDFIEKKEGAMLMHLPFYKHMPVLLFKLTAIISFSIGFTFTSATTLSSYQVGADSGVSIFNFIFNLILQLLFLMGILFLRKKHRAGEHFKFGFLEFAAIMNSAYPKIIMVTIFVLAVLINTLSIIML